MASAVKARATSSGVACVSVSWRCVFGWLRGGLDSDVESHCGQLGDVVANRSPRKVLVLAAAAAASPSAPFRCEFLVD